MLRILVLDDDPERHAAFSRWFDGQSVVHASSAEAARQRLAREHDGFDFVFLDYDLCDHTAGEPCDGNGLDIARFIADGNGAPPGAVIVHSTNPVGSRRMVRELRVAGVPTSREPFGDSMPTVRRYAG